MAAYLICRVCVSDPHVYARYVERTPAIIADHGGRILARGGAIHQLEGDGFDGRIVLVEFPSVEAARAFYESPAYRESRHIRADAAQADFMIVEGV